MTSNSGNRVSCCTKTCELLFKLLIQSMSFTRKLTIEFYLKRFMNIFCVKLIIDTSTDICLLTKCVTYLRTGIHETSGEKLFDLYFAAMSHFNLPIVIPPYMVQFVAVVKCWGSFANFSFSLLAHLALTFHT